MKTWIHGRPGNAEMGKHHHDGARFPSRDAKLNEQGNRSELLVLLHDCRFVHAQNIVDRRQRMHIFGMCALWIVGGDFNEPRTVFKGNQVISFGADEDGVVEGTWRGQPNSRWQESVARVLQPTKTNVHAWLSRNEAVPTTTHVVRGIDRFFDHLLTSEHFDILDAGFEHSWRAGDDPMSDHSAAWATLSKKP